MVRKHLSFLCACILIFTLTTGCGQESPAEKAPNETLSSDPIIEPDTETEGVVEYTPLQMFYIMLPEAATSSETMEFAKSSELAAKQDSYGNIKVAESKDINVAGVAGNQAEYIYITFSDEGWATMMYYPNYNHKYSVRFYRFGEWDDVVTESTNNDYYGCYLPYELLEESDNDIIEIADTDTYRNTTYTRTYIRVSSREIAMARIQSYNKFK